jgi:hypothetical protein
MEKIRITDNLTGEIKVIEVNETLIPEVEPTPIEPTLEEKYEELQSLVSELLEVLNG